MILFAHYSLPLKNPQNEPGEEIFLGILKCYANGAQCSNSIAREQASWCAQTLQLSRNTKP